MLSLLCTKRRSHALFPRQLAMPAVAMLAALIGGNSSALAKPEATHFDVVISTGPTHNMALNNGIYGPTGNNAVLNIDDLTSALATGNIGVTTGNGAGGKTAGNLDLDAALHWVSGNSLTLDAYRSVRLQRPVTDAGAGALAIATHDGGKIGRLEFSGAGKIVFSNLANALSINGQTFTLVGDIASLAAAIAAAPDGNYALAASYDASTDKTYQQFSIPTVFEGNFEGLGNTISRVSIRGYGFFNMVDWGASVSNLRLRDITVDGRKLSGGSFGALASESFGALYGDAVSGRVMGGENPDQAGGLTGGGNGSIEDCSSAATVTAHISGPMYEGGLVGYFDGTITDSFATGDVTAKFGIMAAGGLVGQFQGAMRHSHATGNIRGLVKTGTLGGLIGLAIGRVETSYATGNVKAASNMSSPMGGLIGAINGSISESFATGEVGWENAREAAAGLAGASTGSITNSYATGATANNFGGATGLLGNYQFARVFVSSSYATGKVTSPEAGGFTLVTAKCPCFLNDYWDVTTSGTADGIPNGNAPGVTGYTTEQLQAGLPHGFDPTIWAQDRRINKGLPYLIANPPPQ